VNLFSNPLNTAERSFPEKNLVSKLNANLEPIYLSRYYQSVCSKEASYKWSTVLVDKDLSGRWVFGRRNKVCPLFYNTSILKLLAREATFGEVKRAFVLISSNIEHMFKILTTLIVVWLKSLVRSWGCN
jgi:hypothetical protein